MRAYPKTLLSALLAAAALAGLAPEASAQPYQPGGYYYTPPSYYAPPPPRRWGMRPRNDAYSRPHVYVGAAGVGVAVLDQTGPNAFLDHGGGFELFVGVRFGRLVGLEVNWQPTFHNNQFNAFGEVVNTLGLQAITADLKLFLAPGFVQPYVTIGGGAYILGDRFSAIAEGPGWEVGGGVDFWIGPYFSLGLKAQYRGVALISYDLNSDNTYVSLFTGSLNAQVHF